MLGGKTRNFAIKGVHKQDKSEVYVELLKNGDINIIPTKHDLAIRKLALFKECPYKSLKIVEQNFRDYDFSIVVINYEFKIHEMKFTSSCNGCLYQHKSAYSCFGCESTQNGITIKMNYVEDLNRRK